MSLFLRQCSLLRTTTPTLNSALHTTALVQKEKAGRYKFTMGRIKPITYEMAFKPHEIKEKKGFNSANTGQLEDTFLKKEEIGQDLPHKMFVEDLFIRKFVHGTWPQLIMSEILIKRQLNLVRVAALVEADLQPSKMYFLIGYTEEMLSFWLKAPVKLELQVVNNKKETTFRYI